MPKLADAEVEALLAASDAATLSFVVDLYHRVATEQEKPAHYLAGRGIEHPELFKTFRLGFADRTLGLRLPSKQVKAGAALRAKLERLGIFRESGHEHHAGRLVVPFWSLEGEVAQLYGRAITPNLRPGTPDHLYLPAALDGVFNPEALSQ